MIEALFLTFCALLVVALGRFSLCFIQFVLLSVAQVAGVLILIRAEIDNDILIVFFSSADAFLIGLIVTSAVTRSRALQLAKHESGVEKARSTGLWSGVTAVLLLAAYHYYEVGLPILSDEIDEQRFLQAASGLLGLPSRVAIYGPVILLIFSAIYLSARLLSKRAFWTLFIVSAGLLAVQGHKSALITLLISLVVVSRFVGTDIRKLWLTAVLITAPVAMAFLYAVFKEMGTLEVYSFFEYLGARLSYISVQPVVSLLSNAYPFHLFGHSLIVNDLLYPFLRAFDFPYETANTQLSRAIYGVEPGAFSVPVTPGFIAYYHAEFGRYGGYVASGVTGCICVLLYRGTERRRTVSGLGASLFLEYVAFVGLSTGNFFYLLPNALLALAVFSVVRGVTASRSETRPLVRTA